MTRFPLVFRIFWLGKRANLRSSLRQSGRSGKMSEVSTCLWFGKDAELAVRFYVTIVPGSRIDHIQRSPAAWPGGKAGDVILINFQLGGQRFQALNGGTPVEYGTAASISVQCADQAEVDRLWAALTAGGGSEIMCGWLRDRWGIPWQIVPEILPRLLADPDPAVSVRAFSAMQSMVKLDAAALERAAAA
jgi:predicted 3-demethylubiquinone-9 3-methyltransferase (glyoxalase superfamily)